MKTKLQLFAMGVNQTLVIALLPQLGAHLGLTEDTQDWGWLIALLNVNLLAYWLASGWWGNKVCVIGLKKSQRFAAIGVTFSTFAFAIAFHFPLSISLIVIGLSRFATGCFTSAFLPISQSNVVQKEGNSIAALSKQSSYITIGRLFSPVLIFLPLPFYVLLLVPCLITFASLFAPSASSSHSQCKEVNEEQTDTSRVSVNPFHGITSLSVAGLTLAMSTTALVACTQLVILPFIIELGYSPEQSSVVYAQLMLYISVFVIISQRWIIPALSSSCWLKHRYPFLLLGILHLGASLLFFTFSQWIFFALALSFIAIGVTGLPSWYTHRMLQMQHQHLSHSQISGGLAQAHSLGHILGTGLSASILFFAAAPQTLLWLIALLVTICTYRLSKRPTTKDKSARIDLITSSTSKRQNENA